MLQAGLHLLEQLGVGVQGVGGGGGGSLALEELSFSWDLNNVNNLDNILNSKRFASLKRLVIPFCIDCSNLEEESLSESPVKFVGDTLSLFCNK